MRYTMDDYLKEALEIARAQASVRVMSEEEITSFIQKVAAGIRTVAEGEMPVELDSADMQQDARKSIKEKSVTCLECGKTFKILTKRHLACTAWMPRPIAKSGASRKIRLWCARRCSASVAAK